MDARKDKFSIKSFFIPLEQERGKAFLMRAIWNFLVPSKVGFLHEERF